MPLTPFDYNIANASRADGRCVHGYVVATAAQVDQGPLSIKLPKPADKPETITPDSGDFPFSVN